MTVKDLKSAISNLPPRDLREFRSWFEEFDAQCWDSQIEKDVHAGKLDPYAEQALDDFTKGKCSKL